MTGRVGEGRGLASATLGHATLVHADWSAGAKGRWWAAGEPFGEGRWRFGAPHPVGDARQFADSLLERFGAPLVLGLDLPIGLPAAYARRALVADFPSFLAGLGAADFGDFARPAASPEQIGLGRPFYPARPGGSSREHLWRGLGLDSWSQLLRRCERATAQRAEACALFWTLGGNQVGRAALAGWRELLAPALLGGRGRLGLWPFGGSLAQLVERCDLVVAETYPAQAAVQLGLGAPGSGWAKRRVDDRRAKGRAVAERVRARGWTITPELESAIAAGFGAEHGADDGFDAVLGLVAMAEVAAGHESEGAPVDADVRAIEGWILGLGP